MSDLIVMLGILIGIAWHIAMPYLEQYRKKLPSEAEFKKNWLIGFLTMLYAVPLALGLFLRFDIPAVISPLQLFALAFCFGYTMYNGTSRGYYLLGIDRLS